MIVTGRLGAQAWAEAAPGWARRPAPRPARRLRLFIGGLWSNSRATSPIKRTTNGKSYRRPAAAMISDRR